MFYPLLTCCLKIFLEKKKQQQQPRYNDRRYIEKCVTEKQHTKVRNDWVDISNVWHMPCTWLTITEAFDLFYASTLPSLTFSSRLFLVNFFFFFRLQELQKKTRIFCYPRKINKITFEIREEQLQEKKIIIIIIE